MKKTLLITLSLLATSAFATCPNGKSYPVTITFDDGPKPENTAKVLDVLKEENIKATFFVLGEHFPGGQANPANKWAYDLLDREKAEGHYIGSHTYHHLQHSLMTQAQMKENIMKANPYLKDYLSPILRLPYGDGSFRSKDPVRQAKNDMVMKTVRDAGFKHVGWDIDTEDWNAKKRAVVLPSTLKQICQTHGGIILFHDIQNNTVAHLKEWIQAIKAEGHTFVGMEQFVPEVKNPLSPASCEGMEIPKPVKELSDSVQRATQQLQDSSQTVLPPKK